MSQIVENDANNAMLSNVVVKGVKVIPAGSFKI